MQLYDENDVRRARFIGRQKEVKRTIYLLTLLIILILHCFTLKIDRYLFTQIFSISYFQIFFILFVHFVQVNENFAINLVAEEPVSYVESRTVSCDGGGGALGHPKVYINLVNTYFI